MVSSVNNQENTHQTAYIKANMLSFPHSLILVI